MMFEIAMVVFALSLLVTLFAVSMRSRAVTRKIQAYMEEDLVKYQRFASSVEFWWTTADALFWLNVIAAGVLVASLFHLH